MGELDLVVVWRTIVSDSANCVGLICGERNGGSGRAGCARKSHYELTVYLYNILQVLSMRQSPPNSF